MNRDRLPLLAFVVSFALLFVIVALGEGIGDPRVPPGAVAIVEDVPGNAGTITYAELQRGIERYAVFNNQKRAPKPGHGNYEYLKHRVLGLIIEGVWTQGAAAEWGIIVTPIELNAAVRRFMRANFETQAEYDKYLQTSHRTQNDVERELTLAILNRRLSTKLGRDGREASTTFYASFDGTWKSRTFCASEYAVDRCENFGGNGHPADANPACYEAKPAGGPPSACPASVPQLAPALPGTVSPSEPRGWPLAQRPRPAGLQPAAEPPVR